jgi:hypothetical protein
MHGEPNEIFENQSVSVVVFQRKKAKGCSPVARTHNSDVKTVPYFMDDTRKISEFGYGCYHSVQNVLLSRLLSKNVKIKIFKSIILPLVLHERETRSLTLMGQHRLF